MEGKPEKSFHEKVELIAFSFPAAGFPSAAVPGSLFGGIRASSVSRRKDRRPFA